jgi:hypothetical protein
MNKHVQIRNLAGVEHRKLKQRAAAQGLTITEYVKRLIAEDLSRPSWEEIAERLSKLDPLALPESTSEMIRVERDGG